MLRNRTAELLAGGARVGFLGQVHPHVASQFDIDTPVFLFELDVARAAAVDHGGGAPQAAVALPGRDPGHRAAASMPVSPPRRCATLIARSNLVAERPALRRLRGRAAPRGQALPCLRRAVSGRSTARSPTKKSPTPAPASSAASSTSSAPSSAAARASIRGTWPAPDDHPDL